VTNAIIEEFTKDGINDHVGLPLFVSDDFSNYLHKIPGALVLLNTTSLDKDIKTHMIHSPVYDWNENITPTGVFIYAKILEDWLSISLI